MFEQTNSNRANESFFDGNVRTELQQTRQEQA